jgi:hypothetical protein
MANEHVRVVTGADGQAVGRCFHCGKEEPLPAMPCEIAAFTAGLRATVARHAGCTSPYQPPEAVGASLRDGRHG